MSRVPRHFNLIINLFPIIWGLFLRFLTLLPKMIEICERGQAGTFKFFCRDFVCYTSSDPHTENSIEYSIKLV